MAVSSVGQFDFGTAELEHVAYICIHIHLGIMLAFSVPQALTRRLSRQQGCREL